MANKNLLTTQSKVVQIEQTYYSPEIVVPPALTVPVGTMYCFLSKVDPWTDDNDPPQPTGDTYYLKQVFKNMFAAKLIKTGDISPVIQRINWSTGAVYAYFNDVVDMTEKDANGKLVHEYYVKNKYDQVFKCLWNNNGGVSTNEPYFEPGSYGTNGIYQGPNDQYKWKYMYTIDTGLKVKFMDESWIPVAVGQNIPNPIETTAGAGSLDVINLTNNGSSYDSTNSPITITITGDGTGASATATSNASGMIADIVVTNAGSNYTFASVTITSAAGSGAVAIAPTSPIGGHGFDPISELGCSNVMITSEFNGSEGDKLPTDIDFHQIGIVHMPTAYSLSGLPANGAIYRTTTDLTVAPGFGVFTNDEIVYQGESLETATFTARVLSFNTSTNQIYAINKVGTMTTNAPIFGNTSKTARTLLSYSSSDFVPFSGYITYIQNRSSIQRSIDGIEQFRFVLGY